MESWYKDLIDWKLGDFFVSFHVHNMNRGDLSLVSHDTVRFDQFPPKFDFLVDFTLVFFGVVFCIGWWPPLDPEPVCPTCNRQEYSFTKDVRVCQDAFHDEAWKDKVERGQT